VFPRSDTFGHSGVLVQAPRTECLLRSARAVELLFAINTCDLAPEVPLGETWLTLPEDR